MDSQIDVSKLNEADRREVQQFVANEAQKATIQSNVHQLADMCWKKCITGRVSGGTLDRSEESCAQNCVDRWIDTSNAVLKHLETLRGSH
ncbi:hypothetical protein PABG_05568 [Paracoccidioides brasiliensis Pb03]|uniref:Mitochondrial import inner membrane translocase subunit n=3 Tax=Paracoccidioides TaxID=38946 RepID=C1GF48_PARBD|nr:hypothetical protein PAAG_07386 [Paracoccidioides lutzii Pb01]XP_010761456.1 uncharacterized protein PADG_05884 [Paracoccidioides brasiliensis Pb18]EEH23357.1 hypothetical protein PABG_05568 [Paracoccidioides brasiliensis Pb03]ODH20115.1 hypothetical protein ACO22_05966 [Paracoccidioides brasiliensis]EEH36968.1 hypothetical protein PAAG_07386 [Paracoccidioides lutzii Pb01]EEH49805.1 hypothetical protein PADG_05884 [Paracoccidioides brasiliensis Pb18]ODH51723.1 hypothetical protein GX48_021